MLICGAKQQGLTIITDAMAGRTYSGEIVGAGTAYVVQKIDEGRRILHRLKDFGADLSVEAGDLAEISYDRELRGSVASGRKPEGL